MQDVEMTTEIFKLTRELMSPLARVYDPLYAGSFAGHGTSGSVYLTRLRQWLWLPKRSTGLKPEDALLTDRQLAESVELRVLLRNLLRSARSSFDVLLKHLDKIESSRTFLTDVGLYLVSPEAKVVDIIRANYLENWRDVDAG